MPVIDHWWQTETGWPIAANCMGIERLPVKPGSLACAVPGWDVRVVDETSIRASRRRDRRHRLKLPLPPGMPADPVERRRAKAKSYLEEFPGYYKTADAGFIDEDGYI